MSDSIKPKLMKAFEQLTPEERQLVIKKYVELSNQKNLDFANEEVILKETELWLRSIKEVGLYKKVRELGSI